LTALTLTGSPVSNFLKWIVTTLVGWLQGYYLDKHAPPVVDFAKLSFESVSLANRCVARPDEDVMAAAERVFGK
jgi:hypothetical protein